MRISDCSSDVCASDLNQRGRHPGECRTSAKRAERPAGGPEGASAASHPAPVAFRPGPKALDPSVRWGDGWVACRQAGASAAHGADRKRVVWGKSVRVRVDLGGGRINKKKKRTI